MQNSKLEKEDAILTGGALEKERFLFFFFKKASIGIFCPAQAVNYGTCLLLPNILNCLHTQGIGAQRKFRLCNIIYQVHKMFYWNCTFFTTMKRHYWNHKRDGAVEEKAKRY